MVNAGRQFTLGGLMPTTYVSGSGGFLGKHIAGQLKQSGYKVIPIKHAEIKDYKYKPFDYFIFASGYGNHYHQTNPYDTLQANVNDLHSALERTRNIDYRAFVYLSTSAINLPTTTTYTASKRMGEILIDYYAQTKNCLSIRPASIYGEGEADFRFIPTITHQLKNNIPMRVSPGNHDWTYVDDFVDGLRLIMAFLPIRPELAHSPNPIEIGTGLQTSNYEVVATLENVLGIKGNTIPVGKLRNYDTDNWKTNISFLRSLGWKPKYSLPAGLKKTAEYYD